MSDSLGIRFFDDAPTRLSAHDVPLDFKTGLAVIPGYGAFPISQLHRLKTAIRTIANQVVSDGMVEPSEILLNPDGTVLITVTSTLAGGQVSSVQWPSPSFGYAIPAALDFCAGIDALVPLPVP
jgi:hypothetical protein